MHAQIFNSLGAREDLKKSHIKRSENCREATLLSLFQCSLPSALFFIIIKLSLTVDQTSKLSYEFLMEHYKKIVNNIKV